MYIGLPVERTEKPGARKGVAVPLFVQVLLGISPKHNTVFWTFLPIDCVTYSVYTDLTISELLKGGPWDSASETGEETACTGATQWRQTLGNPKPWKILSFLKR